MNKKCDDCSGFGVWYFGDGDTEMPCATCDGTGKVVVQQAALVAANETLLEQALEALKSATGFSSKKVRDQNHRLIKALEAAVIAKQAPVQQAAPVAAILDQALEDAAKECEKLRDDAKEQEALSTFNVAMEDGIEKTAVYRGEFWLTVSTFNAGLKRAATVIRAMKGAT